MNWISSWLKNSDEPTRNQTHIHSEITDYCCSDLCRHDRNVCRQCLEIHKGHTLMEYKKYKRIEANVMKEINCRKGIEDIFMKFHQDLVDSFEAILANEASKFMQDIDKKIYSQNFLEIYKRHLAGKNYYSYIPDFQTSMAQDVSKHLQKTIKEKEVKIVELFKQFISEHRIIMDEYILVGVPMGNSPSQSKIEKVKAMMPFPCQLTPKFQASKNRFQTDKIHKLGIRGPILVVAQSYKGKVFGGFSPKMFPKNEHYEEDNRCRSFLFSLDHCARLPIKEEYKKFAIKGGTNLWFGRGDLVIADECNKGNISWAQIGRAYQIPPGVTGNYDQWLAGALYFQIVQYEIYEVESPSFGR